MASPASTLRAQTEKSTSPRGLVAAFGIHTLIVYAWAVHLSQWLVFHWFGLVAPILQISINMPATDWYLQHFGIGDDCPCSGYWLYQDDQISSCHHP